MWKRWQRRWRVGNVEVVDEMSEEVEGDLEGDWLVLRFLGVRRCSWGPGVRWAR